MSLESIGKILLGLGVAIVVLGGLLLLASRLGLTRFPGNFVWRKGPVTVYFPLGLAILASLVLTIVLNLLFRR